MKPTLYPHEVVVKWFKVIPILELTVTAAVATITLGLLYVISIAITSTYMLDPDATLANTPVYMTSVSSPTPVILFALVMILGGTFLIWCGGRVGK